MCDLPHLGCPLVSLCLTLIFKVSHLHQESGKPAHTGPRLLELLLVKALAFFVSKEEVVAQRGQESPRTTEPGRAGTQEGHWRSLCHTEPGEGRSAGSLPGPAAAFHGCQS